MIYGIGCDIVEYQVSKDLNWENDVSILKRIFSKEEIDIYRLEKDLKFLTGRFAAKEAILKCIGTGMQDGIALTEIQILRTEDGRPIVKLSGKSKEISTLKGVEHWHITISHTQIYSIAFAVAEK